MNMKKSVNRSRLGRFVLLALFIAAVFAVVKREFPVMATNASDSAPAAAERANPVSSIKVLHGSRDNRLLKLQDGREVNSTYVDGSGKSQADYLQFANNRSQLAGNGQSAGARPLSLGSADFNRDGFPDLVSGYATSGGGILTLHQGNPEAFAPQDPTILAGIRERRYPDPFFQQSTVIDLPEAPDFILTGDFNHDGLVDIVVAARGSNAIYLLSGDGHGGFSAPTRKDLPGSITAAIAGEFGPRDGSMDLILGVKTDNGPAVLSFDKHENILDSAPGFRSVSGEVQSLALGQLDDDQYDDLAVLAGGNVTILHGQQLRSGIDNIGTAKAEKLPLSFSAKAISLGNFVWNRDGKTEIAAMSPDNQVHILARGSLDTRPFTAYEIQTKRLQKQADSMAMANKTYSGNRVTSSTLKASATQRWAVVEDIPVDSAGGSDSAPIMLSTRMSSLPSDDLLVKAPGGSQIQVMVKDTSRAVTNRAVGRATAAGRNTVTLDSSSEPVAALPMRVSVDGRPGLVVLNQGSFAPSVIFPDAGVTYHVTGVNPDSTSSCTVPSGGVSNCTTLRAAVIASNANPGADTIVFDVNGTFTLSITGSDNDSNVGDLDINDSLTIVGNGSANTIISTNYTTGCGDCKVFGIDQDGIYNGLTVSFSGVTVQNGFNDYHDTCAVTFQETGGGIDFFLVGSGNDISITNSIITNNKTTGCSGPGSTSHGGGINVDSFNTGSPGGPSGGTVTFTNVTVTNNTAVQEGGGISLFGDNHDVNLSNVTVTGNQSTSESGGGIFTEHLFGGTLTFTNGSISSNTSHTSGGGIEIDGNQVTNFNGTNFANNTASGIGSDAVGGGVSITNLGAAGVTGSTSLNNCTISGNTATNGVNSAGGGVYFNAGYSATISGSDIFNNNAGQGGGVFNGGSDSTPTSTLTINSLTLIHGNSAVTSGSGKGNGGGIGNAEIGGGSNPATTNVTKTHIFGNSATSAGGGISVGGGTFTMSFSRIINNTSGASNSRGLENNSTTGIPTNVSDNWWGCSQNPTTASTPCDSAHTTTGTLTTTPFLQIKTTASQNPIATGSTATLTATVQDSTGANQSAANLDVFLATNATAGTPLPVIWSAVTNTVTTNANSSPLQNVGGFAKATATYNGTTPVHQDPTVAKVDNDFTTGTHPDIVLMTVLSPPSIAKSFGAPTVTVGGVTTLQFTITNPNTGDSLNGVAFTDTFPANIAVGPTPGVVNTCGGTFTAVAGAGSVSLSGGTVAANSSCTVSVNIQGTADGVANNTTGSVTATDAGGLTGNTASASIVVANPISITKGFGAATIPLNGTTSLTFTLTNSNSNTTLNGVAFTDNLPSGLVIATPGNPSTTCSGTFTAANGSSTASLSGATLAPGATCTATVTVQGTTSGVKNNTVTASSTTTGSVTSTGTATVTVVSPPTISKAFGASSIPLNGSTLLSFTITNPASNPVTLTGVGFTDNLPGGLVVSTPNGLSGGCGGGTITAAAGSSSISLSGASLTSGSSCTFSVNVTGVAAGNQINTTSQVTSNEGGNGGTATASIIVVAPPSIAKAFTPTTIAVNATTSLSFTITNPAANTVPLTGVAFTDVLPAGLTVPNSSASACGGTVTLTAPSTITLSGATIATNSQCVFSVTVTGASSGQFTNTTGNVTSTNGGTGNTASATVTVASPPTIAKVFGVASMPVNATTSLTFNIANPNSGIALTGVAFSDNLPAGLVVATPNGLTNTCSGSVTAAAGSGSISLNGGTIAASGSCTITVNVTGTTVGVKNNITGNVTSTETGPGGAATASITITARTTTTSVSFSSNPSVFGQTIQVTATVVDTDAGTKSNPAGSVSFTSGAGSDVFSPTSCTLSPLGSTTDTSTCTVNLTSTTVGTHSITATYGGSAVHAGSSGSATLTVNKANTTSVLVSSQNPSIFGQSVTFTVTVSAVAPGSGIPTGTVTFLDGATPIGTATLDASGVASISTSSLSIGTHSISTSYPGDGNFNGSTSNTVNQVVNKVPTTTTLVSSVNPSTFGQSVTFTATVTSSGSGTPTGTVTFMDGATTLGTGTLSGGVASFSTATLSVGTHSITAVYGGDSTFAGSTSNTVNQVVNKAPSATALASSVNPSVFGQSVTFTATVTSAGPAISSPGGPVSRRVTKTVDARTTAGRAVPNAFGIGTPTGTVTFFDGATPIGTGTLDGSGVATLTISTLSVGTHSITASYSGDGNFLASTSPAVSQVVNKANTTTANVTSTANPSVFGQAVTLSTTVTAVAPGAGTPTGTVTFLDGATPIGTGTLNGAGQASITLNTLAVGTHLIKATYGGSGNFNGSTSATALSQVVNKANTTTTIVASPNPAFVGGSTTYTITVAAVAPGAGTPTGTVQVKDNGVNVGGPVTLVGGSATVTENHLAPPGVHTITAVYSGDGNFNASTGTLSLVVGFRFEDHVTHNVLIVIPPANGQSGQGTWTWISNGVTIFADVPAFISINPIILSVHTISPAVMNATFNLQVGVGSAVLFDPATLHVYILNEVF